MLERVGTSTRQCRPSLKKTVTRMQKMSLLHRQTAERMHGLLLNRSHDCLHIANAPPMRNPCDVEMQAYKGGIPEFKHESCRVWSWLCQAPTQQVLL